MIRWPLKREQAKQAIEKVMIERKQGDEREAETETGKLLAETGKLLAEMASNYYLKDMMHIFKQKKI